MAEDADVERKWRMEAEKKGREEGRIGKERAARNGRRQQEGLPLSTAGKLRLELRTLAGAALREPSEGAKGVFSRITERCGYGEKRRSVTKIGKK
ncbi:hypothetical protein E2C01_014085 [Portunus trituberculatus]|uniref:Uncharacterized protein n=1 Tax=Portunus trituberculatus TaxID=210409 RepID=A0A5B7DHW5_PORTR|nr:hypothetical protein [Portunus trituberculatus]